MRLLSNSHWSTARLELFLLEPEHVGPAYLGWLTDPTVARYLESRFLTHTIESTRAFVKTSLDDARTLLLGIRSKAPNLEHVGNIKLAPIDTRHGLGEIGILIGERSAWGQGIASEAIAALAAIARDQLSLRKLTAGCYGANLGSQKAFAHAGFEIEGVRRAHFMLDERPEDLILMAKWLR